MLKKFSILSLVALAACSGGTVTGPDPVSQQPAPPVAQAPVPTPEATPAVGEPAADPVPGFELWGTVPSTLNVKYTGGASAAKIDTWYTSFDNQDLAIGKQSAIVNSGDTLSRSFGLVCIQADADQPGIKLIGGVFFDKDGAPFNPTKHPEKVAECRECKPTFTTRTAETFEGECSERVRVVTTYTLNSCTHAETSTVVRTEDPDTSERCTACTEEPPPVVAAGPATWVPEILQGQCAPEVQPLDWLVIAAVALDCHQTGTQPTVQNFQCTGPQTGTRNLCRNVACPCVNVPTYEWGAWSAWSEYGACVLGDQTRTRTRIRYAINSCTQERTPTNETETETGHRECNTPGLCYYNVDGDNASAEQASCETAGGIWLNFVSGALHNHCQFNVPGVSLCDFQLTPGKSDDSCLSKPKHGCND